MAPDDGITPKRREDDQPPPTAQKVKDRSLGAVVLLGSIGFLYQLSEILLRHNDWVHFRTPAGVGEVIFAMVCGLVAVAAAIGLDIPSLVKGFKKE